MHQSINVKIKKNNEISYPIIIGNNLFSKENLLVKFIKDKKVIVVHDKIFLSKILNDNNFNTFLNMIRNDSYSIDCIPINAGDKSKNMKQLSELLDKILKLNIDRNTVIIAFGGGVIGDISGFAASILLRGIKFIQIPTTLLAQVDSSVGGKTGVNADIGKNLIGSFYQPTAVIIDTLTLKSLNIKELRAGLSEVIKYGLIADKEFFEWIEDNYQQILNQNISALNIIISKSCSIKAQIVKEDEKENGKRALLNLGHTFAHAIEAIANYDNNIVHGEAVAIGMCLAFSLSCKLNLCSEKDVIRVKTLLQKVGLPTSIKDLPNIGINADIMLEKFKYDKKNTNNNLTFILNKSIGKSFIKNNLDVTILKEFLIEDL